MEEFQEIARPEKMGAVVLRRTVQISYLTAGWRSTQREVQYSNAVPAGHLLGPKIGAS